MRFTTVESMQHHSDRGADIVFNLYLLINENIGT